MAVVLQRCECKPEYGGGVSEPTLAQEPLIVLKHPQQEEPLRPVSEPGSVELEGVFGYTEEDGTDLGRTPLEIRRACILLVIRLLPRLGDIDAVDDARNRWRLLSERTRDQSYTLAPLRREGELTGDIAIDDILARYMRPAGLGAA